MTRLIAWEGPIRIDAGEHVGGSFENGGKLVLRFPCENCNALIQSEEVEIGAPSMVADSMAESEAEGGGTAWCERCETEVDIYSFNQNGAGFAIRADFKDPGKKVRPLPVRTTDPLRGFGFYRVTEDKAADAANED